MQKLNFLEKRRYPRIKEELPARFRFTPLEKDTPLMGFGEAGGEEFYVADTANISCGGAFLKTRLDKKELGEEIILELNLGDEQVKIETRAKPVWFEENEDCILGMGIKFIDIEEESKSRWDRFIKQRLITEKREKIKLSGISLHLNDRERRNLKILSALARKEELTMPELAETAETNTMTISNTLKSYIKQGLVWMRGLDISSGGRRPIIYQLNKKYGYVLGAELNLDKNYILSIVFDFRMHKIAEVKPEIKSNNLEKEIQDAVLKVIEKAGILKDQIQGVGIAMSEPGNNKKEFKETLEKSLGLPVLIEDSRLISVFAESWQDAYLESLENIIYIDSDEHCSMILGGQLYLGTHELVGEIDLGEVDFSEKISLLIRLLDPEMVIISQELISAQGNGFMKKLKDKVERQLESELAKSVKIISGRLKEEVKAQAIAGLVMREIFIQVK